MRGGGGEEEGKYTGYAILLEEHCYLRKVHRVCVRVCLYKLC